MATMKQLYQDLTDLNEQKQGSYGNTYEAVGQIMAILFPEGIPGSSQAFIRMHLVGWIVGKLCRYVVSIRRGHPVDDSLKDLMAYAGLLYCEEKNNGN